MKKGWKFPKRAENKRKKQGRYVRLTTSHRPLEENLQLCREAEDRGADNVP